jgi:hypothetical protein
MKKTYLKQSHNMLFTIKQIEMRDTMFYVISSKNES